MEEQSRPSSSSSQLNNHHLLGEGVITPSRVTTPSSPGSTSGDSLSAGDLDIDIDSDAGNDMIIASSHVHHTAGQQPTSLSPSISPNIHTTNNTSSSLQLQLERPTSTSNSSNHQHNDHHSTTNAVASSSITTTSGSHPNSHHHHHSSRTSLSSRRQRHHHHQHNLSLGTGSAKMGSSITDSAPSTEDEEEDREDDEIDTEDDRPPRVLYPALATPKAIGNNFWPFGTIDDATTNQQEGLDQDHNAEYADALSSSNSGQHHHHHDNHMSSSYSASRHALPGGDGSHGANTKHIHSPTAPDMSNNLSNGRGLHNGTTGSEQQYHHHHQHDAHNSNGSSNGTSNNNGGTGQNYRSGRNGSLALSDSSGGGGGNNNTMNAHAMEVYRHQVNAPSGANAAFLPHEILLKVLRNIRQTEDLVSALQVCKSWCQCGVELLWNKPLFPHVGPLIKMLVVFTRPQVTFPYSNFIKRLNFSQLADKMSDALLSRLIVCQKLERLTLAGCSEIGDDSMTNLLQSCKNLVALDLSDCIKMTDETVKTAAKRCSRLQGLNLSGCKAVTDLGVQAIASGCPMLRRVKLRNLDTLTDDAIIALALSCKLLLEVDLYACSSITDRTLWALFRNSSHLRELSLNNCTQVTGEGFPQRDGKLLYIKGSQDPALQGLTPLNPKFSSAAYAGLSKKVAELYGGGASGTTSSSSGLGLPDLSNATPLAPRMFDHVRYLDLTGMTNLTDSAMDGLVATMPHIRNLVLAKCSNLTDESVHSICKLGKHIHFLHLGHVSNITDKAVTTLARNCTRLRYIDLACCPNLTDLSVFELAANLPRLKRIGLVRVANLTDQAIFALAERTTLERIHLSYCEHVSVSAVQFLLSKLIRLNHLSLTGVPAFRRTDLQHFCRPPPKDFNPHQRSTFCVYSGKGVHELRKHLMALQHAEATGSANGNSSLIPHINAHHGHANQHIHHHQFAQLQLGTAGHPQQHHMHQQQQLPTYPHLFQTPAGHAVISQMPLQEEADDVDEAIDEDDDDNGDDEADEDRALPEGEGSSSRRHHHHHHHQSHHHHHSTSTVRPAPNLSTPTSQSHNSQRYIPGPNHGSAPAQHGQGSRTYPNQAGQAYDPVTHYRGNHRMTGVAAGSLLDGGSESGGSSTSPPSNSRSQEHFSHSFYSTPVNAYATAHHPSTAPPRQTFPAVHQSQNQHYHPYQHQHQYQFQQQPHFGQNASGQASSHWSNQAGNNSEPLTHVRMPQGLQSPPASTLSAATRSRALFTPSRAHHVSVPVPNTEQALAAGSAHNATEANNAQMYVQAQTQSSNHGGRWRSDSVEMELPGDVEVPIATTTSASDDQNIRLMRPRRDTIMQSTFRPEE